MATAGTRYGALVGLIRRSKVAAFGALGAHGRTAQGNNPTKRSPTGDCASGTGWELMFNNF